MFLIKFFISYSLLYKIIIPIDQSKLEVISNMRHSVRHLRFFVLSKPCHIKRSQKNNALHTMQVLYKPNLTMAPNCLDSSVCNQSQAT